MSEPASDRPRLLRLGTRASDLAMAQAHAVARALEEAHPEVRVELVPIVSRGDKLPGDLSKLGGKGLFTAELEAGLHDGSLDLAVHSLKDLPVHLPDGLAVAGFPERADPRDHLVSEAGGLDALPRGGTVLTGSMRRGAQIRARRPDLRVAGIRGNVATRLRKWRASGEAATVLAKAGLDRLGMDDVPGAPLAPAEVIPAPGQGTLVIEVKAGGDAEPLCLAIDDPEVSRGAEAERRVVAAFGGDCTLPLGAWARREDGRWRLDAVLATPDGERTARGSATGDDPAAVAERCIEAMRRDGAAAVLTALGR